VRTHTYKPVEKERMRRHAHMDLYPVAVTVEGELYMCSIEPVLCIHYITHYFITVLKLFNIWLFILFKKYLGIIIYFIKNIFIKEN
jgi:hypothetical protein